MRQQLRPADWPVRWTFSNLNTAPPLVQTCTVRCALEESRMPVAPVAVIDSLRHPPVHPLTHLLCAHLFCPPLFLTGWVMRPAIFVGTAAWFADLYVMYWREKGIRRYKRIEDEIICYLMEDGTSKSTPSVSIEISGVGFWGSHLASESAALVEGAVLHMNGKRASSAAECAARPWSGDCLKPGGWAGEAVRARRERDSLIPTSIDSAAAFAVIVSCTLKGF
jgi:hypothetical protein